MRKIDIAGNVAASLLGQLKTTAITCSHQFASNRVTVSYSRDNYVLGHVYVSHRSPGTVVYCWTSWDGEKGEYLNIADLADAVKGNLLYPTNANNRRNYGKAKLKEYWAKAYAADSGMRLA